MTGRNELKNPLLVGSSVILLLLVICGSNTPAGYEFSSEAPWVGRGERRIVVAYTPHDPVSIASDADFAAQGWPGDGTKNNPGSGT